MDGITPLSRGVRLGGDDSSALASNWKTLLIADAGLALVAVVVGVAALVGGHVWGVVPVLLGLVYGFFVGGRAARWRRLRSAAGL